MTSNPYYGVQGTHPLHDWGPAGSRSLRLSQRTVLHVQRPAAIGRCAPLQLPAIKPRRHRARPALCGERGRKRAAGRACRAARPSAQLSSAQ
jgi:hypothetical protein